MPELLDNNIIIKKEWLEPLERLIKITPHVNYRGRKVGELIFEGKSYESIANGFHAQGGDAELRRRVI